MSIKQSLNNIDIQLEAMPKKNRLMVFASVALVSLGISYYGFGLSMMEANETKKQELSSLESDISKIDIILYKKLVAKEKKRRLLLSHKQENEEYISTSLRVKLESMDYLSTDEKGLADLLDRILKQSVKLHIKIDLLKIDALDGMVTKHIDKRGKLTITGKAKFYDIQKLLAYIESQEALIKIEKVKVNLNEDESLNFPDFEIVVLGYEVVI